MRLKNREAARREEGLTRRLIAVENALEQQRANQQSLAYRMLDIDQVHTNRMRRIERYQRRWHDEIRRLMDWNQRVAENLFFVMEFAEGGDLRSLLQLVQMFIEPVATFYAAEVALALQFLHKQGIVHRDLKLDNILLDKEGHIKVSDFGLAKCGMFGETRTKSFCGTHEYMAPEIALRLQYGHEVDWWALGVTIYEMLAGHRPFWPHDDCTVLDSIVYDSIWYPESLSREAVSILQGFLRRDPSRRLMDPDDIRSHPFFKPVEWDELEKKQE